MELWQAWYSGSPVPGTLHPIQLGLSREKGAKFEEAAKAEFTRSMEALYGETRRWWNEGRVVATRGQ